MKRICMLLMFVALSVFIAQAQKEKKIDGITYRVIDSESVSVYNVEDTGKKDLVIPESVIIKGHSYKVTEIEYINSSSEKNNSINSIVLPNSVKNIGSYAFYNVPALNHVVLSESLQEIPDLLFSKCEHLKEIILPKGIKRICRFAFASCPIEEMEIPEGVEDIGFRAFVGCRLLRKIVLPNSLKRIGQEVFWRCDNLETIIMPDKKPEILWFSSDSKISNDKIIFKGVDWNSKCLCEKSVTNIQGHIVKYPLYLIDDDFLQELFGKYGYKDRAFVKEKVPFIKSLFSVYAHNKVTLRMTEWQKKKEYETTAQWKERVTEETQKAYLAEVIDEIRKEYITDRAPKKIKGTIGMFDADYGVYPITAEGISNTFHVQVPIAEARTFKENWNNVAMNPVYGVVDDQLAILSCTFNLNGKTYRSTKSYSNDNTSDMVISLPPLEINLGNTHDEQVVKHDAVTMDKSLDIHIPSSNMNNDRTFAVIIGNENYQRVTKVDFANNDAKIFAAYCQKTLGLPERNIRSYSNATYASMMTALRNIAQIAKAYKGDINVIFYYAGHGMPNESTHEAYLLPVDVDGSQTELCLSVGKLYKELNAMNARKVVVFMDACFSGSQRGDGMLTSARGVALKVKKDSPIGNMVVFSAASGDETAYPYKEKGHGLFTYYLLKKLQETKGDVTLGELGRYIVDNVTKESVVSNGKSQTPTVVPSDNIGSGWENMKLR